MQVAGCNFLHICMLVSNTDMESVQTCCTEVAYVVLKAQCQKQIHDTAGKLIIFQGQKGMMYKMNGFLCFQ